MLSRVRALAAALCLGLAVLLVPLAVTGWWVRGTVADTDRWTATVAPLASDPVVQDALVRRMTASVMSRLDQAEPLERAGDALVDRGAPAAVADLVPLLAGTLREEVAARVEEVARRIVTSPAFAEGWETANRLTHAQLVGVLEGDGDVVVEGTVVSIRLATYVDALQAALVSAGIPGAERLEPVEASLPFATTDQLEAARTAYAVVDRGGVLLPLLALTLAAGGIALARRRRRALMRTAGAGVAAIVLLLLGLSIARGQLVAGLPAGADPEVTRLLVDQITGRLRALARATAVALLVVAMMAAVTGDGPRAVGLRRGAVARASTWVRTVARRPEAAYAGWALAAGCALLTVVLPSPGVVALVVLLGVGAAGAVVGAIASRPATAARRSAASRSPSTGDGAAGPATPPG